MTLNFPSFTSNSTSSANLLRILVTCDVSIKRIFPSTNLKKQNPLPTWVRQIRSYVLHSYKMVKDLRTEVESNNPEAVLAGDLDQFIEAEIKLD